MHGPHFNTWSLPNVLGNEPAAAGERGVQPHAQGIPLVFSGITVETSLLICRISSLNNTMLLKIDSHSVLAVTCSVNDTA